MPRPSREPEILEAALGCFAERGYDATRVRHIAERAGVSEAALYRHHPSKEAVAAALFDRYMREHAARLADVAGDRSLPVGARVRRLAEVSLDAATGHPEAYAFVQGHQARFMDALPPDFPYPLRVVEGLLREGQEDGSVRPGSVRVLAALVLGCINQPVIVARHARPGTIDLGDAATVALVAEGAWAAVATD